ncbi:MAG: AAA family ATPase [Gemmatimonadota bacterium]
MRHLLLFDTSALLDHAGTAAQLWRTHTALLAYLALSRGARAPRDVLARLLWPDAGDHGARLSLRQALFRLRKEAGEVVRSDGDMLEVCDDMLEVDVIGFELDVAAGRCAAAAARYTGDLLADFVFPGSLGFEQWLDGERARLRTRAAEMLQRVVDDATSQAAWSRAVQWAERWTRLFPLSDAAAERLIALYAQTGDRQRAMLAYQDFARRLHDDLDAAPGRRVENLIARIRRVSRPLEPVSLTPTATGPAPEAPFVGRSDEFGRLVGRWQRARSAQRQIALVSGPAGIGKSRLTREFAQRIRLSGGTVLAARACEMERMVSHVALAELFAGAAEAPGVTAVDPAKLAEAGRVVPRIAQRFTRNGGEPSGPVAMTPQLLDAMRALTESLAEETPVLLVLEDAHHADAETLAVICHVLRQLPAARLLAVLTATDTGSADGTPVGSLFRSFGREASDCMERIALGPLGEHDVRDLALLLVTAQSGVDVAGELYHASGGHPGQLVALLRQR